MSLSGGKRIFVTWPVAFTVVVGLVFSQGWLQPPAAVKTEPRELGNIRLAQASTLTLLIDGPTRFPTVTLRAIVGPVGCRIGRHVSLHQVVAGSTVAIPIRTAPATQSSGHAVFGEMPNVEGTQYQAIVADDPAGCDGAVSNVVTMPGPI